VPNNTIYYYNDEVTLNAYPEDGYEFDSWIGDIENQINPYTFNITDDIIVSGKFAQEFYNITKIINGEGNVSIGPNKTQYAYNDEVTLYASPKVGYEFSHWGTNTSDNNPTKSIIITDDITITANFIPKVLSLNINNDSSKGIVNITPNDTEFNYGTNINIQITPNDGYIFDKVYGDYNTSELNFSFDIFEDMELTISYSSKQYRINSSVSPAGSGSIKLNKDNNIYNYNEN
jgi:hypothetical protein